MNTMPENDFLDYLAISAPPRLCGKIFPDTGSAMKRAILLHYHEINLKGNNRWMV